MTIITNIYRQSVRIRSTNNLNNAAQCQRQSTIYILRLRSSLSFKLKCIPVASFSTTKPKQASAKSSSNADFSKYPPVKPNPYSAGKASRSPPIRPYEPIVPTNRGSTIPGVPEDTHRKVRKKILGSLVLFFVALVTYQTVVQPMLMQATSESQKSFEEASKGKNVVIVKETTVGGDTVDTVDSGTSHVGPLPTRIFMPTKIKAGISDISGAQASEVLEEYTLVGHGIRTVSFLSVQVYVVALYVATSSLPNLQNALLHTLDIPSTATTATLPERDALRKSLLDETTSVEVITTLLDRQNDAGIKMAIRIVPTRNTDFPHLRDGWVRGITAKTKLAPELYDDDQFLNALGHFKTLFGGKNSVAKGGVMILARDEKGNLAAYGPDENMKNVVPLAEGGKKETAMHGLKCLGAVDDERISRALWLCYWAGKKVASEGARKSVVEGLVDVVARPVGSTEGKVI